MVARGPTVGDNANDCLGWTPAPAGGAPHRLSLGRRERKGKWLADGHPETRAVLCGSPFAQGFRRQCTKGTVEECALQLATHLVETEGDGKAEGSKPEYYLSVVS